MSFPCGQWNYISFPSNGHNGCVHALPSLQYIVGIVCHMALSLEALNIVVYGTVSVCVVVCSVCVCVVVCSVRDVLMLEWVLLLLVDEVELRNYIGVLEFLLKSEASVAPCWLTDLELCERCK